MKRGCAGQTQGVDAFVPGPSENVERSPSAYPGLRTLGPREAQV